MTPASESADFLIDERSSSLRRSWLSGRALDAALRKTAAGMVQLEGSTEVRADSRLAIIAAGRELFGTRGYAPTSLVDVARAAHVTKGAVYHHFGSKEGLFRAVYDAVEQEAQFRPRGEADPDQPAIEVIQTVVAAYLDTMLDPIVQRVTLVDGPAVLGPEPHGPLEVQPGFLELRSYIQAATKSGSLRAVDADAVARVIRGASLQCAMCIAQADDPVAARDRFGEALRVLIGGLAGHSPTTGDAS